MHGQCHDLVSFPPCSVHAQQSGIQSRPPKQPVRFCGDIHLASTRTRICTCVSWLCLRSSLDATQAHTARVPELARAGRSQAHSGVHWVWHVRPRIPDQTLNQPAYTDCTNSLMPGLALAGTRTVHGCQPPVAGPPGW